MNDIKTKTNDIILRRKSYIKQILNVIDLINDYEYKHEVYKYQKPADLIWSVDSAQLDAVNLVCDIFDVLYKDNEKSYTERPITRWIDMGNRIFCSSCGWINTIQGLHDKARFCPQCGVKMEEKTE